MKITHVWSKSVREIEEIYRSITGQSGRHDEENRFEWVGGTDPEGGLQLNLSREHGRIVSRDEADAIWIHTGRSFKSATFSTSR